MGQFAAIYFGAIRFLMPAIAVLMLCISIKLVLHNLKRKTLARFAIESYADVVQIKSSNCIIGSSILCDVKLKSSSAAKQHAVLELTKYGFKLTPTAPENKVYINGRLVEGEAYLMSGDRIMIGTTIMQIAVNPAISMKARAKIDKASRQCRLCNAVLLTLFQLLTALSFMFNGSKIAVTVLEAFAVFVGIEWLYFLIKRFSRNIGVEIATFFLATIGLCVNAGGGKDVFIKTCFSELAGLLMFILFSLFLKNLNAVNFMQIPVMVFSAGLLIFNMFFGVYINGSRNWVSIGGFSFQPSEFVKVALIFISACALDKMLKMKNLIVFLSFSGFCLLALAYMRDFGTASIYFVAIMVILCLRLCDIKIVGVLGGAAALVCFALVKFIPYISERFATYRHAWEYASEGGYQQVKTMIAIANGGLFGTGAGNGHFKVQDVAAADTDLVFGMVSEQFGLIIALIIALVFIVLMLYAAISIPRTKSIYYAVTAAGASTVFIFQTALNIFGSVDILPLTGVTLPFISNGGSACIAAWLLLAFISTSGGQYVNISKKEE